MLHSYDGKILPNQRIYYFRSQPDNVIDNDTIIIRLFIGTLMGVVFDWFRSLPEGFINSWLDLKTQFLSQFHEDDTKVTMDKLPSTVQKREESVRDYVERFRIFYVLQACLCYVALDM